MSIKSVVLPKDLIKESRIVFDNKIVKSCFEENMWIAGGFARKIGHLILGLAKTKSLDLYLLDYLDPCFTKLKFGRPGDIDFFTSDQNAIYKVSDRYRTQDYHSQSNKNTYFAYSAFASNLIYTCDKVPNDRRKSIKIQLVRKFCFESIKSCFESFDITNSKYAISKSKNGDHYVLHYDDEALKYDYMNMLHINHSNTPYLASRIAKYLKNRNLKAISSDKKTTDNFNDYLFKCVINKWDSLFNIDESYMHNSIKAINQVRKLSDLELSMFIGKISHNIATSTRSFGAYGVYMTTSYHKTDWASQMLLERA